MKQLRGQSPTATNVSCVPCSTSSPPFSTKIRSAIRTVDAIEIAARHGVASLRYILHLPSPERDGAHTRAKHGVPNGVPSSDFSRAKRAEPRDRHAG
jgi:hypothetical protein